LGWADSRREPVPNRWVPAAAAGCSVDELSLYAGAHPREVRTAVTAGESYPQRDARHHREEHTTNHNT
jgi:hypothetical protein